MAPRVNRLVVLAGAPEHADIRWEEDDLTSTLLPCVSRFLGEEVTTTATPRTESSSEVPKWRRIDLPESIQAQDANVIDKAVPQPHLLPTAQDQAEYDNFLEHSFAALEELDGESVESSEEIPVPAHTSPNLNDTSFPTITSLSTTSLTSSSSPIPPLQLPTTLLLTPLSHLPTPSTLLSRPPPITLLVGVISAPPSRRILLRRPRPNSRSHMDLIELLVGDDTRAGVRATFWLETPVSGTTSVCPRRKALEGVRAGDVLLLRRMAVAAWRGVVYVQSMGWSGGGGTVVERVDEGRDVSACGVEFDERVGKVRGWVEKFVGRTGRKRAHGDESWQDGGGKRVRRSGGEAEGLPPDTQETGAG